MKRTGIITTVITILMLLAGCRDYSTRVINKVNADGSVDRTVFITREAGGEFEWGDHHVPVDDSWAIRDSMSISETRDTTFYLIAEKHFANVEAINAAYDADTAVNCLLDRSAAFNKKFKWFSTAYRFSETIEGLMDVEVPMEDYLDKEELRYYYLPESISDELQSGSDSTYYKTLSDTIEYKTEYWLGIGIIRQWVLNLRKLTSGQLEDPPGDDAWQKLEEVMIREEQLVGFIDDFEPDSLIADLLGEAFVSRFGLEIDSAEALLEEVFSIYMEASAYDMEIRMPGTITGTNGYLLTGADKDESGGILWTVSNDYYLARDYSMWVESEVPNTWAWYVSAAFLAFVALGFFRPWKKRR